MERSGESFEGMGKVSGFKGSRFRVQGSAQPLIQNMIRLSKKEAYLGFYHGFSRNVTEMKKAF